MSAPLPIVYKRRRRKVRSWAPIRTALRRAREIVEAHARWARFDYGVGLTYEEANRILGHAERRT